jgi:hypothetical protein
VRRFRLTYAASIAAATTVLAVTVSFATSSGATVHRQQPASKGQILTASSHEPARVLAEKFKVFARSRSVRRARVANSSGLSVPAMPPGPVARNGLSSGTAQYVQFDSSVAVWLFPGSSGACVFVPEPNSAQTGVTDSYSCNNLASVVAGHLLLWDWSDQLPHGIMVGLVPNGVASVDVHMGDGVVNSSAVRDNVYAAPLDGSTLVSAVTLNMSNGSSASLGRFPISVP